jgi:phage terminase large subunit-like protein
MSGDVPDSFRGPNFGLLWADELAHWIRAQASWDLAQMALRHGPRPVAVVTTTPIGSPLILSIAYELDDAGMPRLTESSDRMIKTGTAIVQGHTRDNAENLASSFVAKIQRDYGGTRLGAQELDGQILIGSPGAVWKHSQILRCRPDEVPARARFVVAVDPAVTSAESSDESGVIVAAESGGRCYVISDHSGRHTPADLRALVHRLADAHRCPVVVESNQGGDYLREVLGAGSRVQIRTLSAVKGKRERWTSAALAYDRGDVLHVGEVRGLVALEHQMTSSDPDDKQARRDRADALAWAVLDLLGVDQGAARLAPITPAHFARMRSAFA